MCIRHVYLVHSEGVCAPWGGGGGGAGGGLRVGLLCARGVGCSVQYYTLHGSVWRNLFYTINSLT